MYRLLLLALGLLYTATSAMFTQDASTNVEAFERLSTGDSLLQPAVRLTPPCGMADAKCSSSQVMYSQGHRVAFPPGYSKIFLSSVGGNSMVKLQRPDGGWTGGANNMGCSAFGGYKGSGLSYLTNLGTFPVIAWAC